MGKRTNTKMSFLSFLPSVKNDTQVYYSCHFREINFHSFIYLETEDKHAWVLITTFPKINSPHILKVIRIGHSHDLKIVEHLLYQLCPLAMLCIYQLIKCLITLSGTRNQEK